MIIMFNPAHPGCIYNYKYLDSDQ